jgi:hypothetical protein
VQLREDLEKLVGVGRRCDAAGRSGFGFADRELGHERDLQEGSGKAQYTGMGRRQTHAVNRCRNDSR